MLSSFGFNGSREAQMIAQNAKMSEYAAAVALSAMDRWASTRLLYQQTAFKLRIALKDVPQVQFQEGWGLRWVSSVCVVRIPVGTLAIGKAGAINAALLAAAILALADPALEERLKAWRSTQTDNVAELPQ
jgi:hypothetical protein